MSEKRSTVFEVYGEVDDRWQLFAAAEVESLAVKSAKDLLNDATVARVKVERVYTIPSGKQFITPIFEEDAPPPPKPMLQVTGDADGVVACMNVDDLGRLDARIAISRLLRQFLDKHQALSLDLIYSAFLINKLRDESALLNGAVHRTASAQADALGVPTAERTQVLQDLIEGAVRRAIDVHIDRKTFPKATVDRFADIANWAFVEHKPDRAKAILCYLLTMQLLPAGSLAGKLETLLAIAERDPPVEARSVVDAYLADCMMCPEVLAELFGPQSHRAALLTRFADVVAERPFPSGASTTPLMARLVAQIARGMGRSVKTVLTERLVREVVAERPFDPRDPVRDEDHFHELVDALTDDEGRMIGEERMAAAIHQRKLTLRQARLRAMGMPDAAAALAKVWPSVAGLDPPR